MSKVARHTEDLDRFFQIAQLLDAQPLSFREIGRLLDPPLSDTGVKGILNRMAERYGGLDLVSTTAKKASGNSLTPEGMRLYNQVRFLGTPEAIREQDARESIRFAVSHSLVTTQLITLAIASFLEGHQDKVNLRLELWTNPFFSRVVDALSRDVRTEQAGRLEFALVWGTPRRHVHSEDIDCEAVGPEFDVVAISHDNDWIERLGANTPNPTYEILASAKLATLERSAQPLVEKLPAPNPQTGGDRFEFSTIDAVVACIQSRVADVALIPDIFALLDPLVAQRRLYRSSPLGSIRLALITRKGGRDRLSSMARKLVEALEKQLALLPNRKTFRRPSEEHLHEHPLPKDPQWYQRLKWGYFAETVETSTIPPKQTPPAWLWERVTAGEPQWIEDQDRQRNRFKIEFAIQNLFGREFYGVGEWDEHQFTIRAMRKEERAVVSTGEQGDESARSFTAVFNWGWEERGVIYGVWCGRDWNGKPVVYPELWSHNPLHLEEVCEIARQATIYSTLHPDAGVQLRSPEYSQATGLKRQRSPGRIVS